MPTVTHEIGTFARSVSVIIKVLVKVNFCLSFIGTTACSLSMYANSMLDDGRANLG